MWKPAGNNEVDTSHLETSGKCEVSSSQSPFMHGLVIWANLGHDITPL
jgi:hypothetical protein